MHHYSEPTQNNLVKGSIFALLGFFCMALMGVFTKVASFEEGKSIWISIFTYLTGAVFLGSVETYQGISSIKTEYPLKHFFRAAFGLTASFLYMLSLQQIPIVNATLLFNTAPIFIPLLAMFCLGVHVSIKTWAAIFVGFIGIIIIIQPTEQIFEQVGDLFGLASGISLAIAYLLIKILTKTEPSKRIVFYYFSIGFLLQLPLIYFAGSLPHWQTVLFAVFAGLSLMTAQLFLVHAYQNAKATQIGVYQYSSVLFVGIINWIVWGMVPPMLDLVGVLLVNIAGIIIIREKTSEI